MMLYIPTLTEFLEWYSITLAVGLWLMFVIGPLVRHREHYCAACLLTNFIAEFGD